MNYTGEAFKKWVDDETLYALERRSQQGLSNEGAMSEQVREDVLAALADRAIEVFGKWKGAYPSADDHTNLRASLQPYIQPRLS